MFVFHMSTKTNHRNCHVPGTSSTEESDPSLAVDLCPPVHNSPTFPANRGSLNTSGQFICWRCHIEVNCPRDFTNPSSLSTNLVSVQEAGSRGGSLWPSDPRLHPPAHNTSASSTRSRFVQRISLCAGRPAREDFSWCAANQVFDSLEKKTDSLPCLNSEPPCRSGSPEVNPV